MGTTLSDLRPPAGARRKRKRVGRGPGCGQGKTSGKGQKGQRCRSGSGIRRGFEGGQMPLQRRLPKRGFNNLFRVKFHVTNVGRISDGCDKKVIGPEEMRKAGLVPRKNGYVKVLGSGEIGKSLTIKAHHFSASAKEKIEKAGGKIVVLPRKHLKEGTEETQRGA